MNNLLDGNTDREIRIRAAWYESSRIYLNDLDVCSTSDSSIV